MSSNAAEQIDRSSHTKYSQFFRSQTNDKLLYEAKLPVDTECNCKLWQSMNLAGGWRLCKVPFPFSVATIEVIELNLKTLKMGNRQV